MPTVLNSNRERSLSLSYFIFSLGAVFLITLLVAGMLFALAHTHKEVKAASSSFTFTATGDYGRTSNTTLVLQGIGRAGSSFNLALGDLNYDYPTVSAKQWATYALSELGSNTLPFEFVAGDYDYNNGNGDLSALETLLPDRLGNISGIYGEEYSFDFPTNNPLARFIMVSPVVFPSSKYNYNKNQADYNWVKKQIEAAKSAHLWVIVGMAEGCIYIYSTSDRTACPDGDIFNLLVNENVDLVLQAHVHNYQRSNQFAFNNNCPNPPGFPTYGTTVNAACVGAPTNNYTQGNGTVVVNDGTGGKSLADIIKDDPREIYFHTWMGSNVNPTFGFSQFTVSAGQISMKFVSVPGSPMSGYTDKFTISNSNPTAIPTATSTPCITATPSPAPSPTPSPTPGPSPTPDLSPTPSPTPSPAPPPSPTPTCLTPSPSPSSSPSATASVRPSATAGSTLAQDTFVYKNQSLWGPASDGQTWETKHCLSAAIQG